MKEEEHSWPGRSAVRVLMKQITLLNNGSTICTDNKGQMCKDFETKLHDKISNDNKTRTIKMKNELKKGDVINALLLI